MKRKHVIVALCVLSLVPFDALHPGITLTDINPGKTYGIVVGIDSFEEKGIALQGCVNDARTLHQAIKDPGNEFFFLIDKSATRENILGRLDYILQKSGKGDLIFLYFATHGELKYNDYFLFAHNTRRDNILGTGISSRLITGALADRTSKGVNIFIIIDACYAAGMGFDISRFYSPKVRYGCSLMFSSSPVEESREMKIGGKIHGVFTNYLVKGLLGKADENRNGAVTVRELYNYVRAGVREYVKETTGKEQNPVLIGTLPNEFVVKRVRQ